MLNKGLSLVGSAALFLSLQTGCTLPDVSIAGFASDTPSVAVSARPSGLGVSEISKSQVAWWSNITIDSHNNIYAIPSDNDGIIKISPDGTNTRYFAGTDAWIAAKDSQDNIYVFTGTGGNGGSPGSSLAIHKLSSTGANSLFCNSYVCRNALSQGYYGAGAVDSHGTLYFSINAWSMGNAHLNSFIAKVSATGSYSVLAGSFGSSCADGTGSSANFGNIRSMAIDSLDDLYVLDSSQGGCESLRKVTTAGVVSTVHTLSDVNTYSMALDRDGNFFYITPIEDGVGGASIMKLAADGTESVYCGSSWAGDISGTGACSTVFFWAPSGFGMSFDADGDLVFNQGNYEADDNRLYRVSL